MIWKVFRFYVNIFYYLLTPQPGTDFGGDAFSVACYNFVCDVKQSDNVAARSAFFDGNYLAIGFKPRPQTFKIRAVACFHISAARAIRLYADRGESSDRPFDFVAGEFPAFYNDDYRYRLIDFKTLFYLAT